MPTAPWITPHQLRVAAFCCQSIGGRYYEETGTLIAEYGEIADALIAEADRLEAENTPRH
jgi:hypothetical protein